MEETRDLVFYLVVGLAFACYGAIALYQGKLRFGLGRQPSGLLEVELNGIAATMGGFSILVGGLLFGLSPLLMRWIDNATMDNLLDWMSAVAFPLMFFGMLLGVIIQMAISFGESIRQSRLENSARHHKTEEKYDD